MKKFLKYSTLSALCVSVLLAVGCEAKPSQEGTDNIIVSTEAVQTAEITTEAVTMPVTEFVTETQPPTEPATEIVDSAYKTVLNAYHNAYINSDVNTVYSLFSTIEITAFERYMKNYLKENLGEDDKVIDSIFKRENVLSAIDKSVKNIHSIMESYSTSAKDVWSMNIDETTVEHYTAEELAEINEKLGINATDGYLCEIPFYTNSTNQEVFVAEPSAVLLINGEWCISYSVAFDRLIEFMDIEF